ncbi:MAG TPA: RagB/SusD family nutrient uptake outer membrane protein, partial [Balneolaceae bacterium]|nr:RagB/SusD family nutrient uptake outer membrane protein [Balneolaceae bacterium]
MFKTNKILHIALVAIMVSFMTSCVKDLNTTPIAKNVKTSASVYQTPNDYKQVLAKLYAGYATTGQQGPAGEPDIQGIDEGFSSYIRQLFVSQEIPTDEAVVGWNDPGLPDFNYQSWGASNDFVLGMYSRIYYEISMANEFIRNAKGNNNSQVQEYMAEARFLRALSYWHALDLYGGGVPFVTEKDGVGAYNPKPISSDSLFNYITSELKDIAPKLPAPQQNEYGRADRAAAWALLARVYLNAEVYTGTPHYDDCMTYAKKVIDQGGYTLDPNYDDLFLADNNTAQGIIFAINFDGQHTQTYGGTNYIIHAAVGGNMDANNFGIDGGWAGNRVTPQFVDKFNDTSKKGATTSNPNNDPAIYVPGGYQAASGYGSDWTPSDAPPLVSQNSDSVYTGYVYFANAGDEFKFTKDQTWNTNYGDNNADGTLEQNGANIKIGHAGYFKITVNLNSNAMTYKVEPADSRDTFFTDGQSKEINNISEFTDGYAVGKWKNVTSTGQPGSKPTFADTDFPMFRLADVYLMYAEAAVRTNTDEATALK